MKKAYLSTLGCKVNQFETAALKTDSEKLGLQVTGQIEEADYIIINTCTVTAKAGAESRREIRKAARLNNCAVIVVTGCHAQLAAEELRKIPDIDPSRLMIVGNDHKDQLVSDILKTHVNMNDPTVAEIQTVTEILDLTVNKFDGRTRAYLRVQDGCESYCSYCIVPYARGKSRSLPFKDVLSQAAKYAKSGHKEIVITGIHVGNYGLDLDENHTITSLIELLCNDFPELRFRLSSIEPLEIHSDLLKLMEEMDNFMPHLHIPLQSGDNDILRRMNRRYTAEQFIDIVEKCRKQLHDAAIGLDVLVGFPGETDALFSNTVSLLESLDFTYLHVFPYSKRPGTKAASFSDQVEPSVKQQRVKRLRSLSDKKKKAFYSRFVHSRRRALLETEKFAEGILKGYTDNYIPIRVEKPVTIPTKPVVVELDKLSGNAMLAHIP